MFGPFLCSFLVNYVDYVQLFQIVSIIPILGLAPFLLIRCERAQAFRSQKMSLSLPHFLKAVFSSRNMLVLGYLHLTFAFTNAFLVTLFALHSESNLFLAIPLIALLFGIRGTANMLVRIPSGKLFDRIGYRWPLLLAFAMLTLAYLAISESGNTYVLIFAMVIHGLGHGMRAVTGWSLLGHYTQSRTRNIAASYMSTVISIGEAVGAVVAGALYMILGIQTIFKLASLVTLTGVFAVIILRSPNR